MTEQSPAEFTAARKQRDNARNWKFDAGYEKLLGLKESRPEAFDGLPPTMKMSLGFYQIGKDAAKAEGMDVSGGSR